MAGEHDYYYKRLFAQPRMIEDLVLGFVPAPLSGAFRIEALDRVEGNFASDRGKVRISDVIWRIRVIPADGAAVLVYVLLELQSTPDSKMATRMSVYASLLLQAVQEWQRLRPEQPPLLLPIVLYTGRKAWSAATDLGAYPKEPLHGWHPYQPSQRYHLIDQRSYPTDDLHSRHNFVAQLSVLQHPRHLQDVVEALRRLTGWLADPDLATLRSVIWDFVRWQLQPLLDEHKLGSPGDLQEILEMINVDPDTFLGHWKDQWQEEARLKGKEEGWGEGRQEGILEGKQEGILEGKQQGKQEGIIEGRADTLRRLLVKRFGSLPDWAAQRLASATEEEQLRWIDGLITAASLEQVLGTQPNGSGSPGAPGT